MRAEKRKINGIYKADNLEGSENTEDKGSIENTENAGNAKKREGKNIKGEEGIGNRRTIESEDTKAEPLQVEDIQYVKVDELLNLDVLQQLQDGFASVTGTAVLFCRRDGKILTYPSYGNELIKKICQKGDGFIRLIDASILAAKSVSSPTDNPLTPVRFAGMPIFASPVVVEGYRLATLVVVANPHSCFAGLPMHYIREVTLLDAEELKEALDKTPKLSEEQIRASIKFMNSLATTLAESSSREYHLRHRIRQLAFMHSIAAMFAGRANLKEILNITAQRVVRFVSAKACSIRIYNPKTKELQISAVYNLSESYLHKGPLKLEDSPIDKQALSGLPVYIRNMQTDPRVIYKKEAEEEGLVSGLVIGMIYRGIAVGVIHIYTDKEREFHKDDIESLKAIASQAASAVINARLFREALEAERMQRQLRIAAEIQRRMIPSTLPVISGIDIGCIYEPTYLVGGDFYDFIELPDGKLVVVIADVAGKGMPASLLMASLRSYIRSYFEFYWQSLLDDLVRKIDIAFRRDTLLGEFATSIIGIVDFQDNKFTYVNAGHNPALLVRKRRVRKLGVTGPAFGVLDEPIFKSRSIELKRHDKIILYTDGVVEAMNFDQECFGNKRFISSVKRHIKLRPEDMARNILWDIRRFTGFATQTDDVSLVVLEYKGRMQQG